MAPSSKLYQQRRPLREIVADEIRSRIFSGALPPGARLVERDLADSFSVSRLPVREALRILHNEGLAESLSTRGLIVRTFDKQQVEELFDIREALEALAASQAAVRADQQGLDGLAHHVTASRESVALGDLDSAHKANMQFHDELVRLSRNSVLQETLEPISGRLRWLFRQVPDFTEVCDQHLALVSAIGSATPTVAANAARKHVAYYREQTCALLFGASSGAAQPLAASGQ